MGRATLTISSKLFVLVVAGLAPRALRRLEFDE